MADKFLTFEYDGVNSLDKNVYIINEGEDLNFFNSPSFSHDIIYPKFGEISFINGLTKESREIEFSVLVKDVSLKDYKKVLHWLRPKEEVSRLSFDYNTDFDYNVVVSSIGNGNMFPSSDCDGETLYSVVFNISFTTVGDYAAEFNGISEILASAIDSNFLPNSLGLITANWDNITKTLNVTNNTSEKLYFTLEFPSSEEDIRVDFNNLEHYSFIRNAAINSKVVIYTKYGIIWDETNSRFFSSETNQGLLYIDAYQSGNLVFVGGVPIVKFIIREIV